MDSQAENAIPAFHMWKMFNDTMPALMNVKFYNESNLQRLANIVKSKEFSNIFVYNHDASLSFQEYQEMSAKYKAFTVWLLGRFFNLLSADRLSRLHDLIIDAQLRILQCISVKERSVYNELTEEYTSVFKQLIVCYKNNNINTKLTAFVPQEIEDLKDALDLSPNFVEITSKEILNSMMLKTILIIDYIITENISYYNLNNIQENLQSLLYIMAEGNMELKLSALEIYTHIIKRNRLEYGEFPIELLQKFDEILALFEQIVYDVFNETFKTVTDNVNKLCAILKVILENVKKQQFMFGRLERISNYMYTVLKEKHDVIHLISEDIREGLWDCVSKMLTNTLQTATLPENNLLHTNKAERQALMRLAQKNILSEVKNYSRTNSCPAINVPEVSQTWRKIKTEIDKSFQEFKCTRNCKLNSILEMFESTLNMIICVKIEYQAFTILQSWRRQIELYFFEEITIVTSLLASISEHVSRCNVKLPADVILRIFSTVPVSYQAKNLYAIIRLIMGPSEDVKSSHLKGPLEQNAIYQESLSRMKTLLHSVYDDCLQALWHFIHLLSSGIVDVKSAEKETITQILCAYLKYTESNTTKTKTVPKYLANISSFMGESFPKGLLSLLRAIENQSRIYKENTEYTVQLLEEYQHLYCVRFSRFTKGLFWNESKQALEVKILCLECDRKFQPDQSAASVKLQVVEHYGTVALYDVYKITYDADSTATDAALYSIWENLLHQHEQGGEYIGFLKLLPELTAHSTMYHTNANSKTCIRYAKSRETLVRQDFAEVIYAVLHKTLREDRKQSQQLVFHNFLPDFENLTKESLKHSDYSLQETVLATLENMSAIQNEVVLLKIVKCLLYLIMIPTSKHSLIAVSVFIKTAKRHNSKSSLLYHTYKEEMCTTIVNLCAVNQQLINYSLSSSLERISLVLGFFGTKDFVTQEHQSLLPYFVPLVVKMPAVAKLIEEMAALVEQDLYELLANKYGNIFLHIFLNEQEDVFKKSMKYLEENTGLSGPVLRKRNFKVLLNELLLNFYEKRDRVLLALKLLAQEDTDGQHISIHQISDYLQPRFLGVLQYFDTKLLSRDCHKTKVLQSLSQIFKLMGPKRIAPLRFKIIAMLRTALTFTHKDFPQMNCDVWDNFIRTCDLEVLGPQLATIFISILPLLKHNPDKINGIFKYLVVRNEDVLKDYILDLFFVVDLGVDYEVVVIVRKHMEAFEGKTFKEQLRKFFKYLTHETMDIRVHGLKFLKKLLEKNREELDQMILGYNGIDPTIVELLDILTSGCREKDASLKLACGECIGELGAIEPSHLPRRYAQESHTFTFFITEDAFVINSLTELTRALQAEKNTQNMDRYALAIQETLKMYEISPDASSARHHLWNTFPEHQKELMLPLLSSRYTMVQPTRVNNSVPIYGSTLGSTFQSWVYNWTCSLISTLTPDRKAILQVYLPSLKQDSRTMMHFLPHILLHSLLEGTADDQHKIYQEFMSVINSFNAKQELDPKVLNTRPLYTANICFNPKPKVPEDVKQNQCTKLVFILLDFLERWIREFEWQKGAACRNDANYKTANMFLKQFCKLQLAKVNYQCEEYPRALMYLEDYVMGKQDELSDHLCFLSEIYAQLDEADGVAGVTALQHTEPSLEQRILALEVSGKLGDAAACYERMSHPLKLHHLQGLVQCYLDLDNVNTALNLAEGALERQIQYTNALLEIQAEPLWRLGRWNDLDDLLKKPELQRSTSWGVQVGHALLHLKDGKRDQFQRVIGFLKSEQVNCFGAASLEEGAYQHGYNYIVKLHILNELEQVESTVYELLARPNDPNACKSVMNKLISEWELRIKVVQESVKMIEPILCLRRVALGQAKELVKAKAPHSLRLLDSLLGESWLLSAKTARAAGVHQQAYTYTLKAEEYAPPRLFLEKAKLHWLREEHEQALTTLRRGLEKLMPDNVPSTSSASPLSVLTVDQRKMCAEAKLLIASYNDSTSNVDTDVNIQHYKEAVEMFREWEKSLVCLAQYYDRIFQTFSDEDRDAKGSDMQIHMINYFGKSLQYGTNYVYQSMPRLLSIWFDYGTRLLDVTASAVKDERKGTLLKMTKLIDTFLDRLPSFIFLTAFSQLVSRICHPQKEVYIELKAIIIKLILQYPQQSLWMIVPVIKSSYLVRSKRCAEILNDSRLKTPGMSKFVGDFTKMAEKLIELCNKEINEGIQTTSVNALLRTLPRMLTKDDFSEIMMPTQKFRKLVLPNPDFKSSQHNPFPNHYVHIVGIADEIQILPSLQRPRKVVLKGSDGKGYIHMLKPKDDLRKDFRLMEFNDIVNQLLSREAESRQRRLNIRLYSVAPLNEECGLIEWVPHLVGLRPILMNLYKQRGQGMKGKELKENCCNQRDSFSKKKDVFLKKFIPRHPPILGEWFRKTFPDAQSWLTARTAYIRTTAVISMVGYILGLGDRHGENILLDSTCGDTVHVDFNCLFNKGESFEWPERVPFRLTHNMVSAMGPLGVEGVFRKSCACTLRVLRTNMNTLMSIVTPFVYDPLVSWPRNMAANVNATNAERTNEQAVEHIRNIKLRLQGMVRTRGRSFSIPLSVEGQTNNLIMEAMSIDNLCQMYIGWGPYL